MTPEDELECVNVDTEAGKALKIARRGRYDQLPVRNRTGRIIGLVHAEKLRTMHPTESIGLEAVTFDDCAPIAGDKGFTDALFALADVGARLVVRDHRTVGLVHRSDFNKHLARGYFYFWLSAAEMGLAALIQTRFPKRTWMPLLKSRARKTILQRIKADWATRIDLSPIEYADLTHLLRVVSRSDLKGRLGFTTKSEWEKFVAGLGSYRNRVMHPVRKLVEDRSSVVQTREHEERVRDLVRRLRSAFGTE